MARFAILSVGSFLLFTCSDIWNKVGPTASLGGGFQPAIWLLLLGGLGLVGVAALTRKPESWSGVLLAFVLAAQWVLHCSFAVTDSGYEAPSDTVLVSLHAAVLNMLGRNPYGYDMYDVYSAYGATGQAMTPHLDGAQVETLPYPPLHFLLLRPLLAQGVEGARFLYSVGFSLLLLTIFFYCPRDRRYLVLLPLIANPEFIHYPFYWSSDAVWTLLLALILVAWERPVVRAALLGLACAFKQNPWVFAPFLAVRVFKEEERPWRSLGQFVGLSVATFLLVNLPYMWRDFGAWFGGVFDPMLSPYVPLGRGLSMLTQTGLVPFPKAYYSSLTLLIFVCSVWLYFLDYRRLRPLLWLFPALVLFFSYRSMQHYFIYSIPLTAMELCRVPEIPDPVPAHRRWYVPVLVFAAGFLVFTFSLWPAPSGVEMRIITGVADGAIIRSVEVEVKNLADERLRPNFFGRSGWRTYPWRVVEGPLQLEPGAGGRYKLATDLGYRSISAAAGGQILLSGGAREGRYLAIADLPVQSAFRRPRGLESPNPFSWGKNGKIEFEGDEVRLRTTGTVKFSSVGRSLVLPYGELTFEIKRPSVLPEQAYLGLEVRDNLGQRISVLLGSRESQGYYGPKHFYKTLPSQPGWNSFEVDLRSLYQAANFPLPPLQRVVIQDAELLDRPIALDFQLYSPTPVSGAAVRGVRLEETPPGRNIAELLYREKEYQLLLGDVAAQRRNFDEALKLYSQLWPFQQAVRATQEGSFLVIAGPHKFEGRFPLAGSGWAEPKFAPGGAARPTSGRESSIVLLAKPGLKLELQFYPPCPYRVRWEGEAWRTLKPGETFTAPDPAEVWTVKVAPEDREAALQAIIAR